MARGQGNIRMVYDRIVVVFDICSSSDIVEELTLKNDMQRFEHFLTTIKRYLMKTQKSVTQFDVYKFTGDGWILLFPANTNGKVLLTFLRELCWFFRNELRKKVLQFLDTPPSLIGIKFGVERGQLSKIVMYGNSEYIGRALIIACRLQNAIKDKDDSPAYKALISNTTFNTYFSSVKGFKGIRAKRTLRNIRGGVDFRCRKIILLDA
jgi:hypothetical protein